MAKKIALLIGSLRKNSWNRKVALALIKLASNQSSLSMEIVEIGQLPLYNQDPDDEGKPYEEWTRFRQQMKTYHGFLFLTPEYNRSLPAPLKNAIDVGSRPYGQSIWGDKPGGIISTSPGAIGGFGANQHLRQTFVFLNIWCMQQPEAYLGNIDKSFDEKGELSDSLRQFLENYLDKFTRWVIEHTER